MPRRCADPRTNHASLFQARGERPDVGLRLGIREGTEFGGDTAGDRRRLTAGLEAGEVRPIAPRERTAQPFARLDRGVMDDVDRALVVRRSLSIPRKVAQI